MFGLEPLVPHINFRLSIRIFFLSCLFLFASNLLLGQGLADIQAMEKKMTAWQEDNSYDSLLFHYPQVQDFYQKNERWEDYFGLFIEIANTQKAANFYEQAVGTIDQGIKELETSQLNNPVLLGDLYLCKGQLHFAQTEKEAEREAKYQAFHLYQEYLAPDDLKMGDIFYELGIYQRTIFKPDSALYYFNKALTLRQQYYSNFHPVIANTKNGISLSYELLGQYDKALDGYQEVYQVWDSIGTPRRQAAALANIALIYYKNWDQETSLDYVRKAITILQEADLEQDNIYSFARVVEGNALSGLNEHLEAIKSFQATISNELSKQAKGSRQALNAYINIGRSLKAMNLIDSALSIFDEALAMSLRLYPDGLHPKVAEVLDNIGDTYLAIGKQKEAYEYFNRTMNIIETSSAGDYRKRSKAYLNLARTSDNIDQVQNWGQQAISFTLANNEQKDELQEIVNRPLYLQTHNLLSEKLIDNYQTSNDPDALQQAYFYQEKAELAAQQLLLELSGQRSRISYNEYATSTYGNGLKILESDPSIKEKAPKAFQLLEQARAGQLLASLQNKNAQQTGMIPQEWAKEEVTISSQLAFVRQQLSRATAGSKQQGNLLDQKLQLNQEWREFKDKVANTYPNYFALRFGRPALELSKVQAEIIKEGEALLYYHFHENKLYALAVTKQETKFLNLNWSNTMTELIAELKKDLSRTQPLLNAKEFSRKSHQLYQQLILPFLDLLKGEKLVILPDGPLYGFPFEILAQEAAGDDFRTLPYLVRDFPISYAASASVLNIQRKTAQKRTNRGMLSINPIFQATSQVDGFSLNPLPGSQAEVNYLKQQYAGTYLSGTQANKQAFLDKSSKANLIHLATHALVDFQRPLNSKVIFAETSNGDHEVLEMWELVGKPLHTQLMILAACNSGNGQNLRVEGLMSISRAFAEAGCAGLLSSLWPVQDELTSGLMKNFYEGMEQEWTLDEALQQSKLSYLDNSDPLLAHPAYWSAFVLTGDQSPITLKRKSNWQLYYFGLGAIVLLLGLFQWRKTTIA